MLRGCGSSLPFPPPAFPVQPGSYMWFLSVSLYTFSRNRVHICGFYLCPCALCTFSTDREDLEHSALIDGARQGQLSEIGCDSSYLLPGRARIRPQSGPCGLPGPMAGSPGDLPNRAHGGLSRVGRSGPASQTGRPRWGSGTTSAILRSRVGRSGPCTTSAILRVVEQVLA